MSALGATSLSLAGFIIAIGCFLDVDRPGSLALFVILAVFPIVIALIDMLDHLLDKTLDRWLAKRHQKELEA